MMSEWSNEIALKAFMVKAIEGSNPSHSYKIRSSYGEVKKENDKSNDKSRREKRE